MDRLVIELVGGTVTRFRVGRFPQVEYNGRRRSAVGGVGQPDLSNSRARVATVISLRVAVFPRTADETLRLASMNIGWRIQ